MATAEERQKILEMVASGKLSAAEAAELMASIGSEAPEAPRVPQPPQVPQPPRVPEPPQAPGAPMAPPVDEAEIVKSIKVEEMATAGEMAGSAAGGKKATWLHVRVSDLNTGKGKVTVNSPLRLMKMGLKLGSAFSPELKDVDVDDLSAALSDGGKGILVDVEDEEDGHRVLIYVD